MMIKLEDYQLVADCIRSDQMELSDMVKILQENPQFTEWYIKKYMNRSNDEQKNRRIIHSE